MFKIFSTCICWINILNATLEVSGAVRPLYRSLGVKGLKLARRPIRTVTEKLSGDVERAGFSCFLDTVR